MNIDTLLDKIEETMNNHPVLHCNCNNCITWLTIMDVIQNEENK